MKRNFAIRKIRQMRAKTFLSITLAFLMILGAGCLYAQERETGGGVVPKAPSPSPGAHVEAFGVPLVPGIYLANLMLLYFSNPSEFAANMPAYRAALPQEVYRCLVENPDGCPYSDMAQYFAKQANEIGGSRNKNTFWPNLCQTDARWQTLAASEYRQPYEINQPLGRENADKLAWALGMDQYMVLTEDEYNCMTGLYPYQDKSEEQGRPTIRACLSDLSNSTGHADVPLSSYGLYLDDRSYVRSNCAPNAPCLEFNELALNGSLWNIATECKFRKKLIRMLNPDRTPFIKLLLEGVLCQREWVPSCIVPTTNPGDGDQSKK